MGRYLGRSCRLIFMCVVSVLLLVMELVIAHMGSSLSLASDAFTVLSHLLSMVVGLCGVKASSIMQHRKSTFGFLRADVLGAFGNSVFAVALMFSILVEAIKRYITPQRTEQPLLVLSVGIVGLFFNILNYVIFLDCCYCTAQRPRADADAGRLPRGWAGPRGAVWRVPACPRGLSVKSFGNTFTTSTGDCSGQEPWGRPGNWFP